MKGKLISIFTILALTCMIFSACAGKNAPTTNSTPASGYSGASSGNSSGKSTGSSTGSFTNKYGTSTTKCAKSGCSNYIASSGDTNCCTTHSNKCAECRKYIDGDAMYCMSCLTSAAEKSSGSSSGKSSSGSSSHECYVCGDSAYSKYGSYYYCSDCLALVKAFSN